MLTQSDRLAELDCAFRRNLNAALFAMRAGDSSELERLGAALLANLRASVHVLERQRDVLATVLRLERELARDPALQALGQRLWCELEGRPAGDNGDA